MCHICIGLYNCNRKQFRKHSWDSRWLWLSFIHNCRLFWVTKLVFVTPKNSPSWLGRRWGDKAWTDGLLLCWFDHDILDEHMQEWTPHPSHWSVWALRLGNILICYFNILLLIWNRNLWTLFLKLIFVNMPLRTRSFDEVEEWKFVWLTRKLDDISVWDSWHSWRLRPWNIKIWPFWHAKFWPWAALTSRYTLNRTTWARTMWFLSHSTALIFLWLHTSEYWKTWDSFTSLKKLSSGRCWPRTAAWTTLWAHHCHDEDPPFRVRHLQWQDLECTMFETDVLRFLWKA